MIRHMLSAALLLNVASVAIAQSASPLAGTWRTDDGSATVRIAPCPNRNGLCGTVIADTPEPGVPSLVNQMVLRDSQPQRGNEWRGTYFVDGQSMRARIRMPSQNRATFRVCAMGILCETITLSRI
jgi:uncharacterized protein (DUF2147 family)